jgi:hypothetical protein
MLGWLANLLLIFGSLLIGRQKREAFALTLAGEALWLILSLQRHEIDAAFLWFVFAILSIRNYHLWGIK